MTAGWSGFPKTSSRTDRLYSCLRVVPGLVPGTRVFARMWKQGISLSFRQIQYFVGMSTIGRIGSMTVMIFRNDHDPPHFHVFGTEFSAKFAFEDFELISLRGKLSPAERRAVVDWGQRHWTELYESWRLARAGLPVRKFEN